MYISCTWSFYGNFIYVAVLRECKCTPYFHTLGLRKCPRLCRGPSLLCMNEILHQIGEYRDIEVEDASTGYKRIAKCFEACEDQQNDVAATSSSRLPNRQTMLKWPDFCVVMEKLKKSCSHVWKRIDLDRQYPVLCTLLLAKLNKIYLSSFDDAYKDLCKKAIRSFNILGSMEYLQRIDLNTSSDEVLFNAVFAYARENLALVNIYIKPPVVTRIKKDEQIPVIWFVANCGGILGLCMGFSIVSVFEILHFCWRLILHFCPLRFQKKSNNQKKQAKKRNRKNKLLKEKAIANTVVYHTEYIEYI